MFFIDFCLKWWRIIYSVVLRCTVILGRVSEPRILCNKKQQFEIFLIRNAENLFVRLSALYPNISIYSSCHRDVGLRFFRVLLRGFRQTRV